MRVRVPASIANLGPGFDVLAMAVDMWLEAEAEPFDRPRWKFEGVDPPEDNPFSALSMKGRVRSAIPLGVGLGSSAAARAAAVHGGLVAVVDRLVLKLPAPDLEVALLVAAEPQPTEAARAVLASDVSRTDAVFNASRIALLVHALYTRDWLLLGKAMDDRLHQPARTELSPWLPRTLAAGRSGGAWGAALAGAGPSVFAFCRSGIGQTGAERRAAAAGIAGQATVTRIASWT